MGPVHTKEKCRMVAVEAGMGWSQSLSGMLGQCLGCLVSENLLNESCMAVSIPLIMAALLPYRLRISLVRSECASPTDLGACAGRA